MKINWKTGTPETPGLYIYRPIENNRKFRTQGKDWSYGLATLHKDKSITAHGWSPESTYSDIDYWSNIEWCRVIPTEQIKKTNSEMNLVIKVHLAGWIILLISAAIVDFTTMKNIAASLAIFGVFLCFGSVLAIPDKEERV